MNCKNCNKSTSNPTFCSVSCGTTFNNRLRSTGKTTPKECPTCGVTIHYRSKACKLHAPHVVLNLKDWSLVTLGQAKSIRKYQAHSRIRELARVAYGRSGRPKVCRVCGYTIKVDIAHIKAIVSWTDD